MRGYLKENLHELDSAEIAEALAAAGFSLPKYGADGDYGKEADDAFNHALDELEKLRGLVASPPTSLPPPVPTT